MLYNRTGLIILEVEGMRVMLHNIHRSLYQYYLKFVLKETEVDVFFENLKKCLTFGIVLQP